MIQSSRPRLLLLSGAPNGLAEELPAAELGFVAALLPVSLVPGWVPVLGEADVPLLEDDEFPVSIMILVLLHWLA